MTRSSRLEIEYCRQCGWLPRAGYMAQELLTTFEREFGEGALVPGSSGIFGVRVRWGDHSGRAMKNLGFQNRRNCKS